MEVIRKDEREAVLVPGGKIDINNSPLLKDKMQELYDEGIQVLTVDFTNISSIDSSGLGKLLLFQKKLKDRGGELIISNVTSSYINKMFNMIHLYKVIRIDQ